jgi:hypothetical protein
MEEAKANKYYATRRSDASDACRRTGKNVIK